MRPQIFAAAVALPLPGSLYSPVRLEEGAATLSFPRALRHARASAFTASISSAVMSAYRAAIVILGWIIRVLPNKFDAKLLARRKLICASCPQEAFLRRNTKRRVVEVKQRFMTVPNGGMVVRCEDPPFATGLDQGGKLEIEVHEPMTSPVLHVAPVRGIPPWPIECANHRTSNCSGNCP